MCIKWFKKKEPKPPIIIEGVVTYPPAPPPEPTQSLPHPEEPKDYTKTVANTDIPAVVAQWFAEWEVPVDKQSIWANTVQIDLYDAWPQEILSWGLQQDTPACAYTKNGVKHLAALAPWFNKGVVAHEQAHAAYANLTSTEKAEFDVAFRLSLVGDDLMIFLDKQNGYMNTSNIEGHAEVYRYLGQYMPEQLKKFYPNLF